jgi:hypothetical protein
MDALLTMTPESLRIRHSHTRRYEETHRDIDGFARLRHAGGAEFIRMMAVAAALALLVVFAIPRAPAEVPIHNKDAARLDRIKADKSDRLRVVTAMPDPTPMLVLPPVASAVPLPSPPPSAPPSVRSLPAAPVQEVNARSDFCTRYGLRKIITQGGKSWRCRKSE